MKEQAFFPSSPLQPALWGNRMFLVDKVKFFFIEEFQPVNVEEIMELCINILQPLMK